MSAWRRYLKHREEARQRHRASVDASREEIMKRDALVAKLESEVESLRSRNSDLCEALERIQREHADHLDRVKARLIESESEADSLIEEIERKFGEEKPHALLVKKLLFAKHDKGGFPTLLDSVAYQAKEKRELGVHEPDEDKRLKGLEGLCRALRGVYRERDLLRERCELLASRQCSSHAVFDDAIERGLASF